MRRAVAALVIAVILAACAVPAHVRHVIGPDGQPALALRCHHEENCLSAAGELCPRGYTVLNQAAGFGAAALPNGAMAAASHNSMLIACK